MQSVNFDLYDSLSDHNQHSAGDVNEFVNNFDKRRAFSYVKGLDQTDSVGSSQAPGTGQVIFETVKPVIVSHEVAKTAVTHFISEQEFEGIVIAISDMYFVARLIDLTMDTPDEEVEIEYSEISQDDDHLISVGALFSWNIGRVERNRQITRVSDIRFRRTFAWSKAAIIEAENEANELGQLLGWGHVNSDTAGVR